MRLTDISEGKFPVLPAGLHQLLLGGWRGGRPPLVCDIDLCKLFPADQKIFHSSREYFSFELPQLHSGSEETCWIPPEGARPGLPRQGLGGQASSVTHSITVTEMSELPIYCEGVIDGVKDPARAGQVVSEYVRSLSPCLSLQ